MPFSVENKVGRIVESKIIGSLTDEEVQQYRTRMWALVGGISGRVVLVGDVSRMGVLEPAVEAGVLAMMRLANSKIERSAIVWSTNKSATVVQMTRIVEQANEAALASGKTLERRGFTDKHAAQRWLDEVLSPTERARIAQFIDTL